MVHRRAFIAAAPAAALAGIAQTARAVEPAPQLKFDVSICFDAFALRWVPLRLIGAPPGLMHRPLRRLDDGSFRSAIVTAPKAWTTGTSMKLRNRMQILVIKGEIRVNDISLKEVSFTCLPPGYIASRIDVAPNAEFVLIGDGEPMLESSAVAAKNPDAVFLHGLSYEKGGNLWVDTETGGTTHFVPVPAGWHVDGPEVHPCQEEILCLKGDISPDDIRIMTPGWFLWNPIYGVHGWNLHSTAGGTVLEWHDRKYDRVVPSNGCAYFAKINFKVCG